jgi:hypothetical protein
MPDIETLLAPHRGLEVRSPDTFIFRYYDSGDSDELVNGWVAEELKIPEFIPIGSFCSGDFVCAHPSGKLFVVLHDNFEWWDSDVSLEELIKRVAAHDEELEEDVYSRNQLDQ